jgi:hypothetical protein
MKGWSYSSIACCTIPQNHKFLTTSSPWYGIAPQYHDTRFKSCCEVKKPVNLFRTTTILCYRTTTQSNRTLELLHWFLNAYLYSDATSMACQRPTTLHFYAIYATPSFMQFMQHFYAIYAIYALLCNTVCTCHKDSLFLALRPMPFLISSWGYARCANHASRGATQMLKKGDTQTILSYMLANNIHKLLHSRRPIPTTRSKPTSRGWMVYPTCCHWT